MKKKALIWLLFIIILFLPVADLFRHQGAFTAHDIEQNIARFGAFWLSFKEGHFIPRWSQHLAKGYGGPILMFSYSLPYYLALIFRFLGFSLINTMKLEISLCFIGSGILMYLFLKKHFGKTAAALGSLVYAYTPYRITDIYARGSVPENTAFLIVPLVFWAINSLWKNPKYKNSVFLSLALFLLLISHPFFLVLLCPIIAGYIFLLLSKKFSFQHLKCLTLSLLFFLGLSSYFTIPLLMENKYTHYEIGPFRQTYKTEHNTIKKLVLPQWTFIDRVGKQEYQTWQIGLVNLSVILAAILILLTKKNQFKNKQNKKLLVMLIILLFLSLFLMLKISLPLYELVSILQHVQFPWRFLALTTVIVSLITAVVAEFWLNQTKNSWLKKIVVLIFILALMITILPYSTGHNYQIKTDKYYLYQMETNTEGPATHSLWAAQPEHYNWPKEPVEIIEGQGQINDLEKKSTLHRFLITAETPTRIVDNTFYFPNWQVLVNDQPVEIQFQDPDYRGLITFWVPQGEHQVKVIFKNTRLRKVADLISIFTVVLILMIPKLLSLVPRWGEK